MAKKLRILLTNDDGINAQGFEVLEAIARELSDDVWIVAPEQEQSGASHSLTLHVPVRVRKLEEKRYAVLGTPTDCVLLAAREILPSVDPSQEFDLVLSGVNRGGNGGDDISYSGTVAGAKEATLLNIPAMALSQLFYDGNEIHWDTARTKAPAIIQKLLKQGWPEGTFMNLNFPACPPEEVKGIAVCPQGKHKVSVKLTERRDPRGKPYYWLGGDRDDATTKEDVDVAKMAEGYITVTPVQMDQTDYKTLSLINGLFKD